MELKEEGNEEEERNTHSQENERGVSGILRFVWWDISTESKDFCNGIYKGISKHREGRRIVR